MLGRVYSFWGVYSGSCVLILGLVFWVVYWAISAGSFMLGAFNDTTTLPIKTLLITVLLITDITHK